MLVFVASAIANIVKVPGNNTGRDKYKKSPPSQKTCGLEFVPDDLKRGWALAVC